MSVIYSTREGQAIGRFIKALAISDGPEQAYSYAEGQRARWAGTPGTYAMLKTAISGIGTSDMMSIAGSVATEFLPLVRPRTLADKITGWRRVDVNVQVYRFSGDAAAAIVVEGGPLPVGKFSFERMSVALKKIGGIIIVTVEALHDPSAAVEVALAEQLAKAVGLGTDRAMFDVDSVGSIANSGVILTSAGSTLANIDSDLQRMLAYFNSADAALDSAVFTMSATTAAYLGLLRGTGGGLAFGGTIGARGGSLLGVPVYVSGALTYSGSPSNSQITLFDPSQVLLADPVAADIKTSTSASLQMDSSPTMSSTTPTPTSVVSMYQTNSVAIAGRRWLGWTLANTSACVTLSGVTY